MDSKSNTNKQKSKKNKALSPAYASCSGKWGLLYVRDIWYHASHHAYNYGSIKTILSNDILNHDVNLSNDMERI